MAPTTSHPRKCAPAREKEEGSGVPRLGFCQHSLIGTACLRHHSKSSSAHHVLECSVSCVNDFCWAGYHLVSCFSELLMSVCFSPICLGVRGSVKAPPYVTGTSPLLCCSCCESLFRWEFGWIPEHMAKMCFFKPQLWSLCLWHTGICVHTVSTWNRDCGLAVQCGQFATFVWGLSPFDVAQVPRCTACTHWQESFYRKK